jgi:transcriptional regulator GlxA family with amidase domain
MHLVSDLSWNLCAFKEKIVCYQVGLEIIPDTVGRSLRSYDVVVVPGGPGSRKLAKNGDFLNWIRTAKKLRVSVCTGALILGAAGFLEGKSATTHHSAFDLLESYGARVIRNKRVVDKGDVITARGVSAAVDLGIYLCEKFAGKQGSAKVREQIEYLNA